MTDWDGTFALQYYYDKIARDAALGGKMKLTNEQAMELQHNIMDLALAVVALKRKDYSGDEDPFANFRMSQFVGVPAWRGCMVRLMDKLSRIYHITEAGAMYVKDETLMDTFADSMNYICILAGLVCEELGLQEEWINGSEQQDSEDRKENGGRRIPDPPSSRDRDKPQWEPFDGAGTG